MLSNVFHTIFLMCVTLYFCKNFQRLYAKHFYIKFLRIYCYEFYLLKNMYCHSEHFEVFQIYH